MSHLRFAAIVIAFLVQPILAHAAAWKVGDKVQAWNVAWYDAAIVEIGTGGYAGYYKVHYEGFANEQYLKADSIRARPGAAASQASAPRPGKYVCMGYGVGPGTFRWYLQLGSGTYQQKTPDLPAGTFVYSAAAKRLDFTSGPYKTSGWIGKFSVEREGKTHKIVLRNRAFEAEGPRVHEYQNIYCTLSTDSTYR